MDNGTENMYRKTRVFFRKYGRAVYVSHLDLYRTFQRAFKRAKLGVWETQGFNKHIYLNFILPLSLGTTGVCEPLDVKMESAISHEEIAEKLNLVLPEGLEIVKVSDPVKKPVEITSAVYEITGGYSAEQIRVFSERASIITEKRTKKKGISEIDLKPHIGFSEIGNERVVLKLPAGTQMTINPMLVIDAFRTLENAEFKYPSITRTEILCGDNSAFI